MNDAKKTLEFKFERPFWRRRAKRSMAGSIQRSGQSVNMAEKLLLNPQVDGFFYWLIKGNSHYGRFTAVERPSRIQHTWMSRSTLGEESMVAVTFQKKGRTP